jgi:tRNA G18 (ribose-2'-O)-methylase SpoU
MLMFNVQKQKNFGNLVRSAAAFNVAEVFIVDGGGSSQGKKKMRTFGSQGTHMKTDFRYFDGLKDVRTFCTS